MPSWLSEIFQSPALTGENVILATLLFAVALVMSFAIALTVLIRLPPDYCRNPRAKGGGYNNYIFYTHSSMLRTLQDIFGVRPYLGDALYANDLSDLFKTLRVTSTALSGGLSMTVTNVIPGKTNLVQASPTLSPASWVNIKTNVATATYQTFSDPDTSSAARFYRLVELP